MHHKNTNKKQKKAVKKLKGATKIQKKATKTQKKPCFQTINTLFSRYNRNFY